MENEMLLKMGAIFHLSCALLHVAFPKILNWNKNLSGLSFEKNNIIKPTLHIMNICLLLFWLIFAIIPFFFSSELLTTSIGKTLLISIVAFWLIRIFVLQPVFLGIRTKESWQMIIFFLVGAMFFFIPGLSLI